VTPYAAVLRLGFDPRWTIPVFALLAIPLVMLAFGRSRDVSLRLVTLLGGALLISPYGMYYELALLAPAVAAMPLRKPQDVVIPAIWATSLFVNASVIGLLVVYCWAATRLFSSGRSILTKSLPVPSSSCGRSGDA
jgi:predicted permease